MYVEKLEGSGMVDRREEQRLSRRLRGLNQEWGFMIGLVQVMCSLLDLTKYGYKDAGFEYMVSLYNFSLRVEEEAFHSRTFCSDLTKQQKLIMQSFVVRVA